MTLSIKAFSESLPLADMAAAPPAMVRAKMAQGGVHVTLDWVTACVQVQEGGHWGPDLKYGLGCVYCSVNYALSFVELRLVVE